jgi:hypothetical protein
MDWPAPLDPWSTGDTSANCLWSRRCRRLNCWNTAAADATDRAREKEGEETRKKAEKVPWPSSTADAFRQPQPGAGGADVGEAARLLCLPACHASPSAAASRPVGAERRWRREGSSRAGGESGSIPCAGGRMDGWIGFLESGTRETKAQAERGGKPGEKNEELGVCVERRQRQALLEHSTPLSARPADVYASSREAAADVM